MATVIHTDDWKDYLSVDGLAAVSGVEKEHHIPLMVKEIVDNALDASGRWDIRMIGNHGFYVQDYGPGIPGVDEEIAYLFSISRIIVTVFTTVYHQIWSSLDRQSILQVHN
jgi:hypothetical protein